jgi:hypothetical protein
MKLKKVTTYAVAVVTAVFGFSVVNAGPAAADPGVWRSFKTSPTEAVYADWNCARTTPIETGVEAQACLIRSLYTGIDVQGAVIVHNRRDTLYPAEAAFTTGSNGGPRWVCSRSGVAAKSWSVCYGGTWIETGTARVYEAGVNGKDLVALGAAG